MKYKFLMCLISVVGLALMIGAFNWSKSIDIEKNIGECKQSWNIN